MKQLLHSLVCEHWWASFLLRWLLDQLDLAGDCALAPIEQLGNGRNIEATLPPHANEPLLSRIHLLECLHHG